MEHVPLRRPRYALRPTSRNSMRWLASGLRSRRDRRPASRRRRPAPARAASAARSRASRPAPRRHRPAARRRRRRGPGRRRGSPHGATIQTDGLKREIMRAVAPLRVGTSTTSHGTVSSACSTTDAIRSAAVVGRGCRVELARRALEPDARSVRLGDGGDLRQHRHRLLGILAHRRFAGEHHAIGAVEDRVGHVGGLGARGQAARRPSTRASASR